MYEIQSFHAGLYDSKNAPVLTGIMRGIEREGLRIDRDGKLAQTPHPVALGSALTHPQITTDFSEALLEFITPPTHRVEDLFKQLYDIQGYTLSKLDDEMIWSSSMPCVLNDDATIPVAQYGSSNNGTMKTVYRVGLGHRYGRAMQTVAGLHYNFSLPDAFWSFLHREEYSLLDLQDFKDQKYFALIRNFRRYYWLLVYLFGASPALCGSFIKGREHNLQPLIDERTLHLPYATSLRMGDLGYQSSAQESLYVCYNDKQSYITTLCAAITTPIDEYKAIGLQDEKGEFKQLNTSLLQIENEFYSSIRPKRTAKHGETALSALRNRGVEYIEVRCLDIDPFDPLGVNKPQVRFLDTFLLYCALQDSPDTSPEESANILRNQKTVVTEGRSPKALIESFTKGKIPLKQAGEALIKAMRPVAELLDIAHETEEHTQSLETQLAAILNPELTPSARIISHLSAKKLPYAHYALAQSRHHHETLLAKKPSNNTMQQFEKMAAESLDKQTRLEQKNSGNFSEFLQEYYKQYQMCCDK